MAICFLAPADLMFPLMRPAYCTQAVVRSMVSEMHTRVFSFPLLSDTLISLDVLLPALGSWQVAGLRADDAALRLLAMATDVPQAAADADALRPVPLPALRNAARVALRLTQMAQQVRQVRRCATRTGGHSGLACPMYHKLTSRLCVHHPTGTISTSRIYHKARTGSRANLLAPRRLPRGRGGRPGGGGGSAAWCGFGGDGGSCGAGGDVGRGGAAGGDAAACAARGPPAVGRRRVRCLAGLLGLHGCAQVKACMGSARCLASSAYYLYAASCWHHVDRPAYIVSADVHAEQHSVAGQGTSRSGDDNTSTSHHAQGRGNGRAEPRGRGGRGGGGRVGRGSSASQQGRGAAGVSGTASDRTEPPLPDGLVAAGQLDVTSLAQLLIAWASVPAGRPAPSVEWLDRASALALRTQVRSACLDWWMGMVAVFCSQAYCLVDYVSLFGLCRTV